MTLFKRLIFLVLFLPWLCFAGDYYQGVNGVVGGGCTKGSTISSEDFESDYTNGVEISTQHGWAEVGATVDVFTVTSTSPISGSFSGTVENVGSASNEQFIQLGHTALTTGLVVYQCSFNSADVTGQPEIFNMSDGNPLVGGNRRIQFRISLENVEYLDDATWQVLAGITDNTTFKLSVQVDVDAAASSDLVRIWVDDTEVTYVSARSGYKTKGQTSPVGIDNVAMRNRAEATAGDYKFDNYLLYSGGYCAD